ncbi:unnamed protein product [Ostreobium quekettii]|uniref:Uncharacterized protein n=1 Tax=Ostreobium quekettii TaxID=121088 RepID=A0A8S1INE4_9CHLO|nr:unnamed protein product [Ostreobium quekettii]|eukprot:evm.model.scf_412.3 EVM.evm.TU.scf_412.3   scf_412:20601-24925(+)
MISCLGWIPKATMMAVPAVAGPPPGEGDRISRPPRGGASSGDSSGDDEPADASDGMAVEREGGEGRDAELARAMAVAAEMGAKSAAAMEKDDVEGRGVGGGEGDPLAELDMDHYDSSGDEEPVVARIMRSRQGGEMAPDEDPYMEFGDASDEEDSDADDWAFRPGDLVIPATKVEEEIYSLELWVYEEADDDDAGNLYVHHDLMLPAFPLSLAWMDVKPNMGGEDKANIVAVGSMEPGIELWDIDVVDSVEPVATLDVEGKKRKK